MEYWEIAILAVVVLGVLVIDILMIIQLRRKGFKHYFLAIIIGSIIAAILTPVALFVHLEPKEWVELIFTVILVSITGFYAISATKQADANEKMAKEMQNQRYDMVRPVIDIKINEGHPKPTDKVEFKIVHYTPINVGVGPSIDGYSYMQSANGDITYHSELGTISAHDEHPGFSIKLDNNILPTTLIAYYRDVHGRSFESKRQISQPEKDKALSFGKLEHRKLDKNEDIITRIWPSK